MECHWSGVSSEFIGSTDYTIGDLFKAGVILSESKVLEHMHTAVQLIIARYATDQSLIKRKEPLIKRRQLFLNITDPQFSEYFTAELC